MVTEVYPENPTINVTLHSASGSDYGVYTLNGTIDGAPTPCPETSLYMIVCLDSKAPTSGIIKGYVTGRSLNLIDIENTRYITRRGLRMPSLVENTSQFNDENYFNEGSLNSNHINVRGLDSSSFVNDTGYFVEQDLHSLNFIDENDIIGESLRSLDVAENTDVAKDTSHIIGESLSLLSVDKDTGHIIRESLSSPGAAENTDHISLTFLNQYYVVYRIDDSNKLTSVHLINKEVLNMPNICKLVQKRICLQYRILFNYPSQLKNHIQPQSGETRESMIFSSLIKSRLKSLMNIWFIL
ncbi:2272_t:CDS:1 [Acaulospora morrowiae]|uniref:2272_t:CDS:1 n=1 Tax=Acaulospora morrowiae TaxID=94023 RepID=A0A9N8WM44_9GLOM|nr:2272_t:CDS:1 [Acaulospora morrowiae]